MRAEKWVAQGEDPLASFGFKEAGLQLTLEIKSGDKLEPWAIQFGAWIPSENPFASVVSGGQRLIFEISAPLYQKVLRYLAAP